MSDFLKVVQAVKSGHEGQTAWQKTEFNERLTLLKSIPNLMEEARATIQEIYSLESGCPVENSLDFDRSIEEANRLLKIAVQLQEQKELRLLPAGLMGLITSSKNPFSASLSRVIAALAAGNAVIWKPSTKVEKISAAVFEFILNKANLPQGLVNLVPHSSEIAEAIIDHPAVHKLMFVGSTSTGKAVYARAAQAGKKIQASMSARNSAIVFADIDLSKNIESITRSFFDFHGLGRWRASRIFVQESLYKTFLQELTNFLEKSSLKYLGKLSDFEAQRFNQAFQQAISEKGKSLVNNDSKNLVPRVIFDLTNCSTLQQEEIEGPLVTVSSFKYQFDAVKYSNTSPLGKAAYVWSADTEKAQKTAAKLEVGRVFINELGSKPIADRYVAAKESGIEAEGLADLIQFCSHVVNVT